MFWNILKNILRIIGCILLLASIVFTTIFVYDGRLELYGAVGFVRASNVVYTDESWHFIYTNPMAIMVRYLMYFSINAIGVLLVSRIVLWIMQLVKLFSRIGQFDTFLIVALVISAINLSNWGGWASGTLVANSKLYYKVKDCHSLDNYEHLLGKPVFEGIVQEKDEVWLNTLGRFQKWGFANGRKLVIYAAERPKVYILVWLEDEQIVQQNGCYQVKLPADIIH